MSAKRPVLYVGGGIMLADATAELRQLVDHLQIPVAHTLMGRAHFRTIIRSCSA
jgi:acetolactate synthase-1/2/3 large subunit